MGASKISVKHVVTKKSGKIRTKKFMRGGYKHYRIKVYLEGDLSEIESVVYELHESFNNPERWITRREGGFPLVFWTWGEFDIVITLRLFNGKSKELVYSLKYSNELPADNNAYIDESPSLSRGGK